VIKLRTDDRGSISGRGRDFSSWPSRPDRLWKPIQPLVHWVPGALPLGREAAHSPPSSAEVNE